VAVRHYSSDHIQPSRLFCTIYLAAPLSFRFSNTFMSISLQGRKMLSTPFLYLYATIVSATCFHPNGSIPGPDYQSCNSTIEFSMCCAWNRTYDADQCLQNWLCYSPIGTIIRENPARIRRGHLKITPRSVDLDVSYTLVGGNSLRAEGEANQDMSLVQDPNNPSLGDYSWGDAILTVCQDGSWCCGYENITGCCYKNLGVRLDATGQIISTSTVFSLSSPQHPILRLHNYPPPPHPQLLRIATRTQPRLASASASLLA
jgi:hypothetical protein